MDVKKFAKFARGQAEQGERVFSAAEKEGEKVPPRKKKWRAKKKTVPGRRRRRRKGKGSNASSGSLIVGMLRDDGRGVLRLDAGRRRWLAEAVAADFSSSSSALPIRCRGPDRSAVEILAAALEGRRLEEEGRVAGGSRQMSGERRSK